MKKHFSGANYNIRKQKPLIDGTFREEVDLTELNEEITDPESQQTRFEKMPIMCELTMDGVRKQLLRSQRQRPEGFGDQCRIQNGGPIWDKC